MPDTAAAASSFSAALVSSPTVRQFREILLWPVQLMPLKQGAQIQRHWERLAGDPVWQEVADEFTLDPKEFKERHYIEFCAFLPYVQRFLYGDGQGRRAGIGDSAVAESSLKVFRRRDVARVKVTLSDEAVVDLEVVHIDLYFFYDIDVAMLVIEVAANDLPLRHALDLMYRFGRTYPSFWNADGTGGQCARRVEWLGRDGQALCVSDHEEKAKFLEFVCRHRAPYIARHWAFLMQPLALHHSDDPGDLRYRQLEYQRMPLMAFLTLDDPDALSRAEWVRLALAAGPGEREDALPFSSAMLDDFEDKYCYDRFWKLDPGSGGAPSRMTCSGAAMVMVGSDSDPRITDAETGLLSHFRHQYFLLGLIAHFQRASLIMLSDRLAVAMSHLDIADTESVKVFKRSIRQMFEIFLRFSHRYWFQEVSHQGPARDLFRMWSKHLGTAALFDEVGEEVQQMAAYLDSDGLRRQANSVIRLTVVTVIGMIGTLVTGFLGMNLLAAADEPLWWRASFFFVTLAVTVAMIFYAVMRSKAVAEFLDVLSDQRVPLHLKAREFFRLLKAR